MTLSSDRTVIDKLAAAAIFPFRGIRRKISPRVNQFLPLALIGQRHFSLGALL
jgi:hypothetical protein